MSYPLPGSFEEKLRALDDAHNETDCKRRIAAVECDQERHKRERCEVVIDEQKRRIRELLERFDQMPEEAQWQYHYDEALETLERFGISRHGVPTVDQIRESFAHEKLAVTPLLDESYFLLVPNNDFAVKVAALDGSGAFTQPTQNEISFASKKQPEKITAWQGVFIEAATEMSNSESANVSIPWEERGARPTLREQKDRAEALRSPYFAGVTRDQYIMLLMHAARKGRKIDVRYATTFDADPMQTRRVSLLSKQRCLAKGYTQTDRDSGADKVVFTLSDVDSWTRDNGFRRTITGEWIDTKAQ